MKKNYRTAAVFLAVVCCVVAQAETLSWNVHAKYGATAKGIQEAVDAAKAHFGKLPDDVVRLEFDEGSFEIKNEGPGIGTIDLSGIKPGPMGRLILQGKGIDKTVLVFADNKHALIGRDVNRVTISDMHMTRKDYTVSQGLVVSTAPGKVTLEIQEGFPTPEAIFNSLSKQGRFLRRYTNSKTDPQIVEKDNEQIPWERAKPVEGRIWEMEFKRKDEVANYSKGDLIGIKSKHSTGDEEFGGQTYWFMGGSDILFQSVKWTHKTRGVFRGGFEKVQFIDCVTDRAPPINGQTPCLASPDGGPQIGQPNDPASSGHVVKNCRFTASGDDAVAFFNATGVISGCQIRDAFCRGILVANAPDTVLEGNTVVRCPIQKSKDWRFHSTGTKSAQEERVDGK